MMIVIKLSGEGLRGDEEKYSESVLNMIAERIVSLREQGHRVAFVVGGGNLFRGRELLGFLGIERATADYIGMLATVQNALVLRDYFNSRAIATRVASAIAMPKVCEEYIPLRIKRHLEKGRVVIFAAGLGMPYFSTDTCAVQRALEMGADMLVMAKYGVDGLYSADPRKDNGATLIPRINAVDILERNLQIADHSAIALARDNGLRIKVVAIDAIDQALDDGIGSIIEPV